MEARVRIPDRFVEIDGRRLRYLEDGTGVPAILLHGASLGSSADVFRRNLGPLARGGIRALALDFPGFGKSDDDSDTSNAARQRLLLRFMDALGLARTALIAHSAAGNLAVSFAFAHPERVTHVVILGTGSLLPPLETDGAKVGGNEAAAQARLEERMTRREPTLDETRALLEANLFHHELITDDELALRHENSVGPCFTSFVARHAAAREGGSRPGGETPLWQRLVELPVPLLLIYGKEDRARAADRAALLKERFPQLDVHLAPGCKHLVPWDAAELFEQLTIDRLTGGS